MGCGLKTDWHIVGEVRPIGYGVKTDWHIVGELDQ